MLSETNDPRGCLPLGFIRVHVYCHYFQKILKPFGYQVQNICGDLLRKEAKSVLKIGKCTFFMSKHTKQSIYKSR